VNRGVADIQQLCVSI